LAPNAPAVTLSPTSLAFNIQLINSTSPGQTVMLSNTGNADLTISSIAITGSNTGDFLQSNNCPLSPSTLSAGAFCTFSVTFAPMAAGPRKTSISVSDNASGSPHAVLLTGVGTAVSLSPTSLNFGNQNVGTPSSSSKVTITNVGSVGINIWGTAILGTNPGEFSTTSNCPTPPVTLGAGLNCAVNIIFTPVASGTRAAQLAISNDGGGSPQMASLAGTGTVPPVITSASSTAFTVSTAGSFTVTATGYPVPTLSKSGTLPSSVTFNTTTGVLSGTPGTNDVGTYSLTFTASNGILPNATQNFTLTVNNPAPVLYSISPNAAQGGDGNTSLTVSGSSFVPSSVVYFGATALTTVYESTSQLTATIPGALLPSTTTTRTPVSITVVTPAPGGGVSTTLNFDIWPSYPRSDATSVLKGPPPALKQIPHNGTLVSVLDWTSKDNLPGTTEDVISADHLVTELGIPNTDTTDLTTATANPFLVVAGVLNNSSALSGTEITQLTTYVQNGGTLYLWEPNVPNLMTALGITGEADFIAGSTGSEQRPLTFNKTAADSSLYPLVKYMDAPEEINWSPFFPTADVSRGYTAGSGCTTMATWGATGATTGYSAVLRCNIGSGRAYIFGWRLRVLMELPELQLGNDTGPQGVNALVPDSDICRMLMRGSYEGYAANPQERAWAPGGHHAAFIITYDNDAIVAYQNVPATVDFNESLGINATYNFTTLPYDSHYIATMYGAAGMEDVLYAVNHGYDVEGEGFGHFPDFGTAPYSVGPPTEDASNYMPIFVPTPPGSLQCCTSGLSVIGEVGVSKWLLEHDFGITVTTLRSGFTLVPPTFMQGLAATGYQRDQSYLIGLTRGAFPFAAITLNTTTTPTSVTTYPVIEYPMSISDDASPAAGLTGLNTSTVSQYVQVWEHIIKFNYNNNAPTVVLIHPVDTTARFQVLQQVITDLQSQLPDLWIGDLTTFANFWEGQGVTNARWP
jgi:Putative Ig domain